MAKLRKMLGSVDDPSIIALMRLIETQSQSTIARWSVGYAEKYFLDIYEETYPEDGRPRTALEAAYEWLDGTLKLSEAKKLIKNASDAAREADTQPVAQAAARAIATAAASIHTPTNALGMTFYGAAAIAYHRMGITESAGVYEGIAKEELAKMEASFREIAVLDEPNPVKINWYC